MSGLIAADYRGTVYKTANLLIGEHFAKSAAQKARAEQIAQPEVEVA